MNYNFIKINPKGNYLTLIDSINNPRYVCFANKLDALHCITYMSKFKSTHGYFPRIDLNENKNLKIYSMNSSKKSTDAISKLFTIEMLYQDDLDNICCKNSIGIMYIHNFNYNFTNNEVNLFLSAQELQCVPNMYRFTKNLDDIYNRSIEE